MREVLKRPGRRQERLVTCIERAARLCCRGCLARGRNQHGKGAGGDGGDAPAERLPRPINGADAAAGASDTRRRGKIRTVAAL
eukprot:360647-Chlamydomonas_euryale.AAC.3